MTIVFGALTTKFTAYSLEVARGDSSAAGLARLEEVRSTLFSQVNQQVLYLLYIAIGMCELSLGRVMGATSAPTDPAPPRQSSLRTFSWAPSSTRAK